MSKKIKAIKGGGFFALALAITTLLFFTYLHPTETRSAGEGLKPMPPLQLSQHPGSMRSIINRILLKNGIIKSTKPALALQDIQLLDFTTPVEEGYGDNPEWEVFGFANGWQDIFQIYQNMAKDVSDGSDFIYTTANRVNGLGTEQPDLLAILPNFKPNICEDMIRQIQQIKNSRVKVEIPVSSKLNLSRHPGTTNDIGTIPAISLENWTSDIIYGCFQADGKVYYYDVLFAF